MEREEKKQEYLLGDQNLITELESIGPLSTGQALEEQKRKIQVIQIKTLLKSRKSAKDTEISNINYSNVILIFAGVQVLFASFQFIQYSLGTNITSVKYFSVFSSIFIIFFLFFFYKMIKKSKN